MKDLFFLKNNLNVYLKRFWFVVFGFILLLLGTIYAQPYNWQYYILGIIYLLFGLIFLSKKSSYIKLVESKLLYKKSFFHKVICIDCKSINHINVSIKYFEINTNAKKYKIYTEDIREYEAINGFPDFINKLKLIVNNNSNILAT